MKRTKKNRNLYEELQFKDQGIQVLAGVLEDISSDRFLLMLQKSNPGLKITEAPRKKGTPSLFY